MSSRWSRTTLVTVAACAAVVVTYAVLAYHRRWISDDGLIVVRTVRELLAGNGPTFNAFERAEANTSTLWTYIVALFGAFAPDSIPEVAVVVGAVLAISSIAIAMAASRRWHRARGSTAPLVPFGVLVVIGIFPFWDFATSGLETGLSFFWLALAWWWLVRARDATRWRTQLIASFVFGLGPLVRPDFAIASLALFAVQLALAWPLRRRAIVALIAAAAALPIAYEIVRCGYYGTLVPLPALAKSATSAEWYRGVGYIYDFAAPCLVPIPIAIAVVVLARSKRPARNDILVLAAPLVAAAIMLAFVVRVGGDFMHGRMCLPPLFLAMLPGALVPWRRGTRPFVAAMVVWSLTAAVWHRTEEHHWWHGIEDERFGYAAWTNSAHPDADAYARAEVASASAVQLALASHRRRLLSEGDIDVALSPERPADVALAVGRLGVGGLVVPLDGIVVDTLGLANPLGARITQTSHDRPGHEKPLPLAWAIADFGDSGATSSQDVEAARHALSCGELAELLASVREPLTWSRFWTNLTGSLRRTRLVIPSDPVEAEAALCATHPLRPHAFASSSYEAEGWSLQFVIDGNTRSTASSLGWSSSAPAPQWLMIDLRSWQVVSAVTLYPRTDAAAAGQGLPVDFDIQTWNGVAWVTAVARTGETHTGTLPEMIELPTPTFTDRIRIYATRLDAIGHLQLAEIRAVIQGRR